MTGRAASGDKTAMTDLPLKTHLRLPAGPVRRLVVLLHGYGADGADLISLADSWAAALPGTAFVAPDAPEPCEMSSFGRQWFSLHERTAANRLAGASAVRALVDGYLDALLAEFGLAADRLALAGFSQGTMVGLYTALRRPVPVAGMLGYSGMLVAPERLDAEIAARPPVLLVHGDADPVVPFAALGEAETALRAAAVPVETLVRRGLGHGIDGEGAAAGGRFLARVLGAA